MLNFLLKYDTFMCLFTFLKCFQVEALSGKRPCPVCHQLRTASDKTPDGQIHRVLGRSNKIWCPYADEKSILETFEKEQKERTQAAWRRGNEAK
jgi:hypothetical protein